MSSKTTPPSLSNIIKDEYQLEGAGDALFFPNSDFEAFLKQIENANQKELKDLTLVVNYFSSSLFSQHTGKLTEQLTILLDALARQDVEMQNNQKAAATHLQELPATPKIASRQFQEFSEQENSENALVTLLKKMPEAEYANYMKTVMYDAFTYEIVMALFTEFSKRPTFQHSTDPLYDVLLTLFQQEFVDAANLIQRNPINDCLTVSGFKEHVKKSNDLISVVTQRILQVALLYKGVQNEQWQSMIINIYKALLVNNTKDYFIPDNMPLRTTDPKTPLRFVKHLFGTAKNMFWLEILLREVSSSVVGSAHETTLNNFAKTVYYPAVQEISNTIANGFAQVSSVVNDRLTVIGRTKQDFLDEMTNWAGDKIGTFEVYFNVFKILNYSSELKDGNGLKLFKEITQNLPDNFTSMMMDKIVAGVRAGIAMSNNYATLGSGGLYLGFAEAIVRIFFFGFARISLKLETEIDFDDYAAAFVNHIIKAGQRNYVGQPSWIDIIRELLSHSSTWKMNPNTEQTFKKLVELLNDQARPLLPSGGTIPAEETPDYLWNARVKYEADLALKSSPRPDSLPDAQGSSTPPPPLVSIPAAQLAPQVTNVPIPPPPQVTTTTTTTSNTINVPPPLPLRTAFKQTFSNEIQSIHKRLNKMASPNAKVLKMFVLPPMIPNRTKTDDKGEKYYLFNSDDVRSGTGLEERVDGRKFVYKNAYTRNGDQDDPILISDNARSSTLVEDSVENGPYRWASVISRDLEDIAAEILAENDFGSDFSVEAMIPSNLNSNGNTADFTNWKKMFTIEANGGPRAPFASPTVVPSNPLSSTRPAPTDSDRDIPEQERWMTTMVEKLIVEAHDETKDKRTWLGMLVIPIPNLTESSGEDRANNMSNKLFKPFLSDLLDVLDIIPIVKIPTGIRLEAGARKKAGQLQQMSNLRLIATVPLFCQLELVRDDFVSNISMAKANLASNDQNLKTLSITFDVPELSLERYSEEYIVFQNQNSMKKRKVPSIKNPLSALPPFRKSLHQSYGFVKHVFEILLDKADTLFTLIGSTDFPALNTPELNRIRAQQNYPLKSPAKKTVPKTPQTTTTTTLQTPSVVAKTLVFSSTPAQNPSVPAIPTTTPLLSPDTSTLNLLASPPPPPRVLPPMQPTPAPLLFPATPVQQPTTTIDLTNSSQSPPVTPQFEPNQGPAPSPPIPDDNQKTEIDSTSRKTNTTLPQEQSIAPAVVTFAASKGHNYPNLSDF